MMNSCEETYPKEKSKVIEESDSTIPDLSHQTVTSTPPMIAPFTDVSSTKPSSLVLHHHTTKLHNHHSHLPEITPFIRPSAKRTKLDDALLKILERHIADLIEKYSALPGPESIKNQESEKSPKEIIRIKREQGEEKQDSTYSIRLTDKVALEEFDLKSALFKHMNKNKTANRNPANYHLYHALMEALIADEDAIDKEVVVKVKDHKRKHDSDDEEDDDDDEGPSDGSNQITDIRDDVVNSLMHMLPNNIQITDTSLMHMLNLNPSPHKEDSLVLLSEIPLLCQRRGLQISKNLEDPVAIVALRAVDLIGSPSSTTIDQDEQSTSTLPTNQEIQSQVTRQDVEE
ncbi:hypothetical protein Tco_1539706 [Tanacetum coccineum]